VSSFELVRLVVGSASFVDEDLSVGRGTIFSSGFF